MLTSPPGLSLPGFLLIQWRLGSYMGRSGLWSQQLEGCAYASSWPVSSGSVRHYQNFRWQLGFRIGITSFMFILKMDKWKKNQTQPSAFPSPQKQLFSSKADCEQLDGYIQAFSARFLGLHYEVACNCLLICTLSFLALQTQHILTLISLYFSIWAFKVQWWTAMETFLTCSSSEEFAYFKARIYYIQAVAVILRDIKTFLKSVMICRVST